MKKETNTMLLIISAILGVAALVLIVVSIVGEFKTNWVLAAGLGCVALGSLINTISMIKNRKKIEIAKSGLVRMDKMEMFLVKSQDRELLWNINQKYLYEMTNFYDDEMDAQGNLHYGYFDAYFTDPKRKAFFLYDEKKVLVGFAMIHPYSNLGEKPDYVLAEFTIFPTYRRKHLAKKAAEMFFSQLKGCWEVKYNEKNIAAKTLWNKATEKYRPRVTHLNETESVLSFCTA